MVRRLWILLAAALLALPTAAAAEFKAGDWELTLSGSGSSDNDFDSGGFAAQGSLGYFFTDILEGIIRQEGNYSDTTEGSSWSGSTGIGVDFNFSLMNMVPFLGGTIGYIYGEDTDETWYAAPEGGIKAFVNNTTFIQALVQYQWFFDEAAEADNNFDDGRFVYGLGIGFKW